MSRRVYFSFHYENDVWRTNIVRNSGVIRGVEKAGFADAADFEKVKRQGNDAIKYWIQAQQQGTSVTVVLLGTETLNREWVKYEIIQTLINKKAVIGVCVNNIPDNNQRTCSLCDLNTKIGTYTDGNPIYFRNIANSIHCYTQDNGYNNLGDWIERAAKSVGY